MGANSAMALPNDEHQEVEIRLEASRPVDLTIGELSLVWTLSKQ